MGTVDQILAGRYRLEELVGHGGMGCVWRAQDFQLGTSVAIKLVRPSVASRPGMLERFLREAKAAALLRGAHVVQILDHGVDAGTPFIAMEYLEGESLAARLARERKLAPTAVLTVMTGVARALARAHKKGIIHRDLKPDNIFLARDEAGEIVKVLDFGIAKLLAGVALDSEERKSTETGTMLGTPCYMSPEQARGRKELDARSDLWSFAVIAFECLTGRRPFEADALGELMMQICSEPVPVPSSLAKVPAGFDAWFERATRRDPAERFQTVRDLLTALAEILEPGQPWTGVTADGEPSVDPAPITPFEMQATVPMEVVKELAEPPAPPQDSGDALPSRPAKMPASAPETPAALKAQASEAGRESGAPRRRAGRALVVGAAVLAAAALLGVAVSRPERPPTTVSGAAEAASAPVRAPPSSSAPASGEPSNPQSSTEQTGLPPSSKAAPPGASLAVPPPRETARIIAALPRTAPVASTSALPRATAAAGAAPPARATAAQPTAAPKAPPSAGKAEMPREDFD